MYQPSAIKQLVVPNTAGKHWKRMRKPLLEAYSATNDSIVPQYREPDAEVRRVWDKAVTSAAGVPVARWRKLMEKEPFVAGRAMNDMASP